MINEFVPRVKDIITHDDDTYGRLILHMIVECPECGKDVKVFPFKFYTIHKSIVGKEWLNRMIREFGGPIYKERKDVEFHTGAPSICPEEKQKTDCYGALMETNYSIGNALVVRSRNICICEECKKRIFEEDRKKKKEAKDREEKAISRRFTKKMFKLLVERVEKSENISFAACNEIKLIVKDLENSMKGGE